MLFAVLLTEFERMDGLSLWLRFRDDLSEDFYRNELSLNDAAEYNDEIYNLALIEIEDHCIAINRSHLAQYRLPAPDRELARNPIELHAQPPGQADPAAESRAYYEANVQLLNADQRIAFDVITQSIYNRSLIGDDNLYFIDAPGGTGKTFLLNLIIAYVRSRGDTVLATASSGIAATLLRDGRTAHSTFSLPLDYTRFEGVEELRLSKNTAAGRALCGCKAIIWDEITMANKMGIMLLDNTLRNWHSQPDINMGGVVIIFSGDFRQTLPVVKRGTPVDQLDACVKNWRKWRDVRSLKLSINMRVNLNGGNHDFANQLLDIGDGLIPSSTDYTIRIPNDMCNFVNNTNELIEAVYSNLERRQDLDESNMRWLSERSILAPKNDSVDEINRAIMNRFSGHRDYHSIDNHTDDDLVLDYPLEFLNSQNPGGAPPHILSLRIGTPIMLLRNIKPPQQTNGTRLIVRSLHNRLIIATIISGPFFGETVFIPKLSLNIDLDLFTFKREQFPVKVTYAMTINKSQGQTLQVAGIDLSESCFSHGQFYVACSRVGDSSNLYVLSQERKTKNVVYRSALA